MRSSLHVYVHDLPHDLKICPLSSHDTMKERERERERERETTVHVVSILVQYLLHSPVT